MPCASAIRREALTVSFFDSLFGGNTSSAQDAATAAQIPYLFQAQSNANQALTDQTTAGNAALQSGAKSALDAITSGYGSATGAVSGYGGQGQQQLNGRTDQGVGSSMAGNGGYAPALQTGGLASGALGNALGLNGPGGNQAATSAFQASPGYDFQVQQATDAASRSAAARGQLGSGNTLDAITRMGSHLADGEYQNYLGNLSNAGTQGLSAAGGVSANDRAAGTLQGTAGTTGGTLLNNTGGTLGQIIAMGANQQGAINTGLGQGTSANDTALGANQSNNIINTQQAASGLALGDAKAQDSATNANNGIFSKIIGGIAGLPMGGVSSIGGVPISGGMSFGGNLLSKIGF